MRIFILMLVGAGAIWAAEPKETSIDWRELWYADSSRRWFAKSMEELRREAGGGHAVAMFVLSRKLSEAGTKEGRAEGDDWMKKAAAAGLPQAITREITGTDPSDESILFQKKVHERAAVTGYPESQAILAGILTMGPPVRPDPARALELARSASDHGSSVAMRLLATLYAQGIGEPRSAKDTPGALMERAAFCGNADAMGDMVYRYRFGVGVEKDGLQAAAFRARADARGLAYRVEWMDRISPDPQPELTALFGRALREERPEDLLKLGEMHQHGVEGKTNLVRAAALFAMANASGRATALSRNFGEAERKRFEEELRWLRTGSIYQK